MSYKEVLVATPPWSSITVKGGQLECDLCGKRGPVTIFRKEQADGPDIDKMTKEVVSLGWMQLTTADQLLCNICLDEILELIKERNSNQ